MIDDFHKAFHSACTIIFALVLAGGIASACLLDAYALRNGLDDDAMFWIRGAEAVALVVWSAVGHGVLYELILRSHRAR